MLGLVARLASWMKWLWPMIWWSTAIEAGVFTGMLTAIGWYVLLKIISVGLVDEPARTEEPKK